MKKYQVSYGSIEQISGDDDIGSYLVFGARNARDNDARFIVFIEKNRFAICHEYASGQTTVYIPVQWRKLSNTKEVGETHKLVKNLVNKLVQQEDDSDITDNESSDSYFNDDFDRLYEAARDEEDGETLVAELLASGVNPNAVDAGGTSILTRVCDIYEPNINVIGMLLEAGADPNRAGDDYFPLHIAARTNNIKLCEALINAGADINLIDNSQGWTPIYHTVDNEYTEIFKFLLDKGADISIPDSSGTLLADYAQDVESHDTLELLTNNQTNIKKDNESNSNTKSVFGAAIDVSSLVEEYGDDIKNLAYAVVDLAYEFQKAVNIRLDDGDECYIPIIKDGIGFISLDQETKQSFTKKIADFCQNLPLDCLPIIFLTEGIDHWDYNFLKLSKYFGERNINIFGYHPSYSEIVNQQYYDGDYDEGIESNPDSKDYYMGNKILENTGLQIEMFDVTLYK